MARLRAAAALWIFSAAAAHAAEPAVTVAPPDGWKLGATRHDGADLPGGGEHVYEFAPPAGARVTAARLIVSVKRVAERDLDAASGERHGASVKNRAAWGMQLSAGPPREEFQIGGRRALRYRDRVGGALGHAEQSFTCQVLAGLLACAQITAPQDAQAAADALAAALLSSLSIKKR